MAYKAKRPNARSWPGTAAEGVGAGTVASTGTATAGIGVIAAWVHPATVSTKATTGQIRHGTDWRGSPHVGYRIDRSIPVYLSDLWEKNGTTKSCSWRKHVYNV
jgi:hypothetical protein